MKFKSKRLISIALAVAVLLSMSIPTFATDTTKDTEVVGVPTDSVEKTPAQTTTEGTAPAEAPADPPIVDSCDFDVNPLNDGCSFNTATGVLTISKAGAYTISMKEKVSETSQRIVVNATDEVELTLNGVKIKAPNGAPVSADVGGNGDDALTIKGSGNVTIKLQGTNSLTGGDGAKGANGGTTNMSAPKPGFAGGVGGSGLKCSNVLLTFSASDGTGTLTVTGGNGGDGGTGCYAVKGVGALGGAGGAGGAGIDASNTTITKNGDCTVTAKGGAGGAGGTGSISSSTANLTNSGGNGGNGGKGGDGVLCSNMAIVTSLSATGGTGGKGGMGGASATGDSNHKDGTPGLAPSRNYGGAGGTGGAGAGKALSDNNNNNVTWNDAILTALVKKTEKVNDLIFKETNTSTDVSEALKTIDSSGTATVIVNATLDVQGNATLSEDNILQGFAQVLNIHENLATLNTQLAVGGSQTALNAGVNPSNAFDSSGYDAAKAAWTQAGETMTQAGTQGRGLNVPIWFDANVYMANKLAQLQKADPTADWTEAKLTEALKYQSGFVANATLAVKTNTTATLTVGAMETFVESGFNKLEIVGTGGTVLFGGKTIEAMKNELKGDATVAITGVNDINAVGNIKYGNALEFHVIGAAGEKATEFGDETMHGIIAGSGDSPISGLSLVARGEDKADLVNHGKGFVYSFLDENGNSQFATKENSIYAVATRTDLPTFSDISNHWAKDAIEFVTARELLTGKGDKFLPDATITKGEFVEALTKTVGEDMSSLIKSDEKNAIMTRFDMADIMFDFTEMTDYTLLKNREKIEFEDMTSDILTQLQMAGIIMPKSGNKFDHSAQATRAEVAALLQRYIKLFVNQTTSQGFDTTDSGELVYYVYGKRLTGTGTIDGKTYNFGKDGICTNVDTAGQSGKKYIMHKIIVGDTLWDLSQKHKCTVAEIVKLNSIKNPSNIPVGTDIKIPE